MDAYVISGQPNVRVRVQGSEVVVNDSPVVATPMTYAVQMMPDGTAVAGLVTGEDFSYGGAQIDDRGILQMERSGGTLEAVRYSLPAETTN